MTFLDEGSGMKRDSEVLLMRRERAKGRTQEQAAARPGIERADAAALRTTWQAAKSNPAAKCCVWTLIQVTSTFPNRYRLDASYLSRSVIELAGAA
jgi:hypothetical protein